MLLSTDCVAVKNKEFLCDGKKIANINAVRCDKEYEGQGHISKLFDLCEEYAKSIGIKYITIGAECKESRNLAIYFHKGFCEFCGYEILPSDEIFFIIERKFNT